MEEAMPARYRTNRRLAPVWLRNVTSGTDVADPGPPGHGWMRVDA
jgi:hypothetical protein